MYKSSWNSAAVEELAQHSFPLPSALCTHKTTCIKEFGSTASFSGSLGNKKGPNKIHASGPYCTRRVLCCSCSAQNLPKICFPNLMLLMNITAVAASFMLQNKNCSAASWSTVGTKNNNLNKILLQKCLCNQMQTRLTTALNLERVALKAHDCSSFHCSAITETFWYTLVFR